MASTEACELRDSLFRCYELPATWALLRALTPSTMPLPDIDDMVQALRSPAGYQDTLIDLHGRALCVTPGVAKNKWMTKIQKLAAANPSEFRLIFGAFSVESDADADEEEDEEEGSVSVNDTDFASLKSIEAYRELTAEQRLRILHTVAELTLQDPKLCTVLTSRPADEIRLGCLGHDSGGNDYFYFGDKQKLFREPGRFPRMKSFAPSLLFEEEENKRKERERVRREAEAERRRQIKLRLEEERRKRIEERKRAAEIRKREKIQRERKRRAERKRKAQEWAPADPGASGTRASKRLQLKMEMKKKEAELLGESIEEEDGEEDVIEHAANGDTTENNIAESSIPKHVEGDTTKTEKTQSTLDSFLRSTAKDPQATQSTSKRSRNLADTITQDEGAASGGATLASENSEDEMDVNTEDPHLRLCTEWELVADGFSELREFAARFGHPSKIENADERALMRRIRDVLLPEFEEGDAVRARKIQKRARLERRAKMEKPLFGTKKSRRLQELDERRAQEEEEERKRVRQSRLRSRRRDER